MKKNQVLNVVCVYFSVPYFFGNQFDFLQERGYDIHLICSPADELNEYAKKHKTSVYQMEVTRTISPFKDIVSIYKMCKYIKKNNIEIVVGHTPKGAMLAMIAAFIMRVPKRIYMHHGFVFETAKGLKRLLLTSAERLTSALATKILCVSSYIKETSIKNKFAREEKLSVLNMGSCSGIDAECIFNSDKLNGDIMANIKEKHKIPQDGWIIGYVGRLVNDKGIPELYESFLRLKDKYPDMYLMLVGPLDTRDKLNDTLLLDMQRDERVILTGMINENIQYFYNIMDLFVLPTHREGFGCCLLEAAAMQVPTLTNGRTGSRDAIVNGRTGLYIDINVDSISEKIEYMYLNKDIASQMGVDGRKFVKDNFQEEIVWNEIVNTYKV